MNPLTLVKRIQNINSKEAALGISEQASWHAKYKESAYVFVGGIPFDLTEGDLLAIFAQYGEIVDVNLVRDKGTGKSKGFAFVAYEDQRSTILAVDNLNGAQILGRIIRVDHVSNYKKKEEEDEETVQQKREARGVCRAFQKGECTRGAGCKFSHDEQRAANTGWGHEDKSPRWGHDKFEGSKKSEKGSGSTWSNHAPKASGQEGFTSGDKDSSSRAKGNEMSLESRSKQSDRREERRSRRHDDDELVPKTREDRTWREERRSRRHDVDEYEPKPREDHNRKEENRLRRHDVNDIESNLREDHDRREEKRSRRRDGDEYEPKSRENHDRVEGKSSRRLESDSYIRDHGRREEKRSRRHE